MTADRDSQRVTLGGEPVVDLSHFTGPEDLDAILSIRDAAAVIVPRSLAGAYTAIPSAGVGATVYVPDGANVRVHAGSLVVGGGGLGAAADVLVVVGMLVITSPVVGELPRQVSVVGSLIAPRGSEEALGAVLGGGSGAVTYYPHAEGQDIRMLTGQVKLSAATLENLMDGPDDILLAVGQVVVTEPVTTVNFARVLVAGQFAAPAAGRKTLEPLLRSHGQTAWYEGEHPRVFFDDLRVGPDFLRLLDHPVSLILLGDLSFSPDVTEAMAREKITGIVAFGDIAAPPRLFPLMQLLATDCFGTIQSVHVPGD